MYVYKLQEIAMTTAPLITLGCIMMSFSSWVIVIWGNFSPKQTRGGKTVLIAGDPISGSCDCRTNSNCSGAKVSFSISIGWIVVTTLEFIPNFGVWELEYLTKMAPHVNLEIGKILVKFIQTQQEPWNYCSNWSHQLDHSTSPQGSPQGTWGVTEESAIWTPALLVWQHRRKKKPASPASPEASPASLMMNIVGDEKHIFFARSLFLLQKKGGVYTVNFGEDWHRSL